MTVRWGYWSVATVCAVTLAGCSVSGKSLLFHPMLVEPLTTSRPSRTPSTIPAVKASQLNCAISFGTDICCVKTGWFMVSISGRQPDRCTRTRRLTLVLALDAPLEPVRRSAETVSVYLRMDELENRDQAVFSFRVLRSVHTPAPQRPAAVPQLGTGGPRRTFMPTLCVFRSNNNDNIRKPTSYPNELNLTLSLDTGQGHSGPTAARDQSRYRSCSDCTPPSPRTGAPTQPSTLLRLGSCSVVCPVCRRFGKGRRQRAVVGATKGRARGREMGEGLRSGKTSTWRRGSSSLVIKGEPDK